MRTALVLLFLLALAAVPGSLVPQRSLSQTNVTLYYGQHPRLAPILDRLGMFNVFSSPWFAAIYLLLFLSLIGCLVPRIRLHARALRSSPPAVPARIDRLPTSASHVIAGSVVPCADSVSRILRRRRWRLIQRECAGTLELSAEKGYLRETGNLLFHVSLLVLLAALAVGKLVGYEGNVLVQEGSGFCNSFQQYDVYRSGPLVESNDLTPLCVDLRSFRTDYDADLTPSKFTAAIRYTRAVGARVRSYPLEVNSPLRIDGIRLYLTGHGFAPRFTITYPDGSQFTDIAAPFLPTDASTLGSQGALKLPDRPTADPTAPQLALEGFFAPTAALSRGLLTSIDPRPRNPGVAIAVYQGNLGLDAGSPQNVYSLDQRQIAMGALKRVGGANLAEGQSLSLADGTVIRFNGYRQWAALQVSHDPTQLVVLTAAIGMVVGLLCSLRVRRRRIWVRIGPVSDTDQAGVRLHIGGLARTDASDFAREFDELVAALVPDAPPLTS